MQEIEMEVEEDAEAEKEDLKVREARKRYTVLCIQSHLYIYVARTNVA